jgi:alanyl-tRNA synthetase
VDYVAAGIYCFQPYCVTGEMDPPANPLICPQFVLRFNDLDNIGITGRHYSGFIMMGIQVFNFPDQFHFFSHECVEFNYNWLTETLQIPPDQITFTEDVWCGGGNLGPSIEYSVGGLELGNMVFMQYKVAYDGVLTELPIQVIDVGIGLERIAWILNGSPTSYVDTFEGSYQFLREKLHLPPKSDQDPDDRLFWEKFGELSCELNVDDSTDIEKTWDLLAEKLAMEKTEIKTKISLERDLIILLDHTRTILMVIEDGSLPSNIGGGCNVRNALRRIFSVLHKNKWMEILKMEGLIALFQFHKKNLEAILGEFPPYKSFSEIIKIEYERWLSTDEKQKASLNKLIKKTKGKLSIDDWVHAVTTIGVNPDAVAKAGKIDIPSNLYSEIAKGQEKTVKLPDPILYDTTNLAPTLNLYETDHKLYKFDACILQVFSNKEMDNLNNIVVLDKSAFYPTSGGILMF